MKFTASLMGLAAASMVLPSFAAQEGELPFDLYNRLRVEYDDNVRQTSEDQDDSFKIIDDLELVKGLDFGNTRINFRYNPSFTWWSDRDEDETDLHHELEAGIYHELSERTWLSVKETFRIAEYPELIADEGESSVVLRENSDYLYNSLTARAGTSLSEQFTTTVVLRYVTLAYDEDRLASFRDYDKFVAGADLGYLVDPRTTVSAEVRYSDTMHELDIRDTDSVQVGGALRSILGPNTVANLRAGYESKTYDSDDVDDSDSPYGDATLEVMPGADTRIVLGAGYSMDESPIFAYANQDRLTLRAGVTQQVTARLKLAVSGFYSMSSYDAEQRVVTGEGPTEVAADDGDEDFVRVSTKVSYEVGPRNSVELSWQFLELASDIRPDSDYDRNRVSLGWKTRL